MKQILHLTVLPVTGLTCSNETKYINSTGLLDNVNGYTAMSALRYNCKHGVLIGNDTRICQNDGKWSGIEPTCGKFYGVK